MHLFLKNTTCLNEEDNCRREPDVHSCWQMHIYAPRRLASSHAPSGRSDFSDDRAPHTDAFVGGRVGGSEWSISGSGRGARQTSEMTKASQTDESAQPLWKERERDVHIHPSILVSPPPRLSPRLQPGAWHVHPHTHTIIFLQVRDALTWWGGAHSVTCACILHGCCTHTEPHTNIFVYRHHQGSREVSHILLTFS